MDAAIEAISSYEYFNIILYSEVNFIPWKLHGSGLRYLISSVLFFYFSQYEVQVENWPLVFPVFNQ